MAVTFSDYVNVLKSGVYHPIAKVEFLRREDESVYSEFTSYLTEGNITINKNNGIRRGVNLTLDNSNLRFKINEDELWINSKFKVSLGLRINEEDFFPNSHGVYILNDPELISDFSKKTINLSGEDKFSALNGVNGGNLTDIYQIPVGTNIGSAIKALLIKGGDKQPPLIENITETTPYTIRAEYGKTIGDLIIELCEMISYDCYYDAEGRLIVEKPKDDKLIGSSWDFSVDEKTYLGSTHKHEFSKVFNIQTVVGANINGSIAYGQAKDMNLSSPTRIQLIGERPAPPITDDIIYSDSLALQRANYELKKSIALQESVSLNCMPVYHLDVGHIVTVTDESAGFKELDRFSIQSINLGLKYNDKMSLTLWKSRDLY
jgi:hypothetical protein